MASLPSPSAPAPSARLTSLDQFRGYTMFGMLLVNFLGSYAVCPRILRHTHDYCSYADTIMPQFFFAAGFALRLSLGRRREAGGKMPWGRALRRIFGLALVAIAWYSICDWNKILKDFNTKPTAEVLFVLFKREYFQTLLHIAVTSLWILPVVTASWKTRVWYAIFSGILHFLISWWFNFLWVNTDPNGIDGGPLGFLSWAVPALCGTLACDAVRASGPAAAFRIAMSGVGVMILGWVMSMGTVLYNVPANQTPALPTKVELPASSETEPAKTELPKAETQPESPDSESSTLEEKVSNDPATDTPNSADSSTAPDGPNVELATAEPAKDDSPKTEIPAVNPAAQAESPKPTQKPRNEKLAYPDPVVPSLARILAWDGSIVEPPFVPPPPAVYNPKDPRFAGLKEGEVKLRKWNYWMMSQRGGNLSYPTFAAGVSLVIYALCLWLCDAKGWRLGLFRTLGTNSLAAYMLHDVAGWIISPYFDHKTSTPLWAMIGFACFTLFVYACCRLLERLGWYIRV